MQPDDWGNFAPMFELVDVSKTLDSLQDPQSVILDVRSEGEFADSHIPGALNLPLLNDAERSEVGTLYKRQSAAAALTRALDIFSQKVRPSFSTYCEQSTDRELSTAFNLVKQALYVEDGHVRFRAPEFSQAPTRGNLIFYCWRGGARSRSMATFFRALGYKASVMAGGHKAFRTQVLEYLNAEKYPFELCTLYGLTGCGKTKILQDWLREGRAVIDLEALAHHRGSAFGQIGISQMGAQKDFENNLFLQMRRWEKAGALQVYVEGESRRIGRCLLPERFMNAMLSGRHIKVERSVDERVAHILREYVEPVPRAEWLRDATRSLESIQKRLGGEKFRELSADLHRGDNALFVRKLLVDYYDKAYLLSREGESFYHEVI